MVVIIIIIIFIMVVIIIITTFLSTGPRNHVRFTLNHATLTHIWSSYERTWFSGPDKQEILTTPQKPKQQQQKHKQAHFHDRNERRLVAV
jgi:hypothetical protein